MPFAGYEDFDACVQANSDKDDPEAYCGKIKHEVEGRRTSVRLTPRDAAMAEVELRRWSSRRVAHDTGARTTIQHCCFCGSGSVYARSDGAAQCDFCDSVFTVQLQPTHSGTPGTVDGERYDPFEDGAIEDEDPTLDPGEEVLGREARLREAWLESQNHTREVPREGSGRLRH